MLNPNDIMEELSYACLHAIAAHAGFRCVRPNPDRDSVDVEVQARGQLHPESIFHGPELKIQLKAKMVENLPTRDFPFQLKLKNYDDLRTRHLTPRLLMVFLMPHKQEDWLTVADDHVMAKRCLYWCNLLGKPPSEIPAERDNPRESVTVRVANKVNPQVLTDLLTTVSRQEDIGE